MKSRLRNLDAVHAERDELIQQLESAKKELFQEQKKARTTIEELKEVTFKEISDPQKFAVIILRFEHDGFTIE